MTPWCASGWPKGSPRQRPRNRPPRGLAVDLVDASYQVLDEAQASTPAQQWLMAHCWEYGFILRYPAEKQDITGIIYEPWHYRYVGRDHAQAIRQSGQCLEEFLQAEHP